MSNLRRPRHQHPRAEFSTLSRRRGGPLRTLILAALLVGSILPLSAGPVAALEGCPNGGSEPVTKWVQVYKARGVTFCRGMGGPSAQVKVAYLQIVDFDANAKMRVVSTVAANTPVPRGNAGTTFTKRTAQTWFTQMGSIISPPPGGALFSTTNAGFFVDTSSSATTALSLPEKTGGSTSSQGIALLNQSDDAWEANKRAFGLGNVNATPQLFGNYDFGDPNNSHHYTAVMASLPCCWDATVAFDWNQDSGDQWASRTFLGTNRTTGKRVYILTLMTHSTLQQAKDILDNTTQATGFIQLDGGGSTQMYNNLGTGDTASNSRAVPEVLAVYLPPVP
jgi:hypothetical protein